MKNKKILANAILFGAMTLIYAAAQADVTFLCYTRANMPVQVYEFGPSNCGGLDSAKALKEIFQDGTKDVLCMYQAGCDVQDSSSPNAQIDPRLQVPDLVDLGIRNNVLKMSMLMCKGTGTYVKSVLVKSDCPLINDCHSKDVFYSFGAAQISPGNPDGVKIDAKPLPKPGESH